MRKRHDRDLWIVLMSVASMPRSEERDKFLKELLESSKKDFRAIFNPDEHLKLYAQHGKDWDIDDEFKAALFEELGNELPVGKPVRL